MKIGILTFHASHNYGAVLQALALQKYLEGLKTVDYCEIVDYRPSWMVDGNVPFGTRTSFLRALKKGVKVVLYNRIFRKQLLRHKIFEEFIKKELKLSSVRFNTESEVVNAHLAYDVLICGSDQIWNPNFADSVYFLDFGSGRKMTKIAYGASFGIDTISSSYTDYVKKKILGLDRVSVREEEGRTILKSITDKKIDLVMDPTFLFDAEEWSRLCVEITTPKNYLLVYQMQENELFNRTLEVMRAKTKLPIVNICLGPSRRRENAINVFDAGPKEFLTYFRNATFVITNSFHGTAFAIINEKPFLTISNTSKNGRMSTLLRGIGLEKRMVVTSEDVTQIYPFADFSVSRDLLRKRIASSKRFIEGSLGGFFGELSCRGTKPFSTQ